MPGRRIVHGTPAPMTGASSSAWKRASGFGCWKKGWGVLWGEESRTIRPARAARRATTAAAVVAGAVQRRNTARTPSRAGSIDSGTVRSPAVTSTPPGRPAMSGRRTRARTRAPASWRRSTTRPPTFPVAPTTRMGSVMRGTGLSPAYAGSVKIGRAENPAAVSRPPGPYGATLQSASMLCSWMFFIWKSASARLATSGNICARGRASFASCNVLPADFARRTSFHSFSR